MDNNEIMTAFDLLLGQLESYIDALNRKGADFILDSNYLETTRLLAKIDSLTQLIRKVNLLKNDWEMFQSDLEKNKEALVTSRETKTFDPGPQHQTEFMNPNKKTPNVIVLDDREKAKINRPQEYNLEFHLRGKKRGIVELYSLIDQKIADFASTIEKKYNKMYIAYSDGEKVCDIRVQNDNLIVWLRPPIEQLDDPHNLCEDVRSIGQYSTGNTKVVIRGKYDIEPVFNLIKQSYKLSRKFHW